MNLTNPFNSPKRLFALIVIGPAVAFGFIAATAGTGWDATIPTGEHKTVDVRESDWYDGPIEGFIPGLFQK